MEISGIGVGAGMGAAAPMMAAPTMTAAPAGVAAAPATAATPTAGLAGMELGQGLSPNLQNLVQTLHDFSSAEILIALMLMNAGRKEKSEGADGGGSAALGFLAGLALAGQVNGFQSNPLGVPAVGDCGGLNGGGGVGGGLGGIGLGLDLHA